MRDRLQWDMRREGAAVKLGSRGIAGRRASSQESERKSGSCLGEESLFGAIKSVPYSFGRGVQTTLYLSAQRSLHLEQDRGAPPRRRGSRRPVGMEARVSVACRTSGVRAQRSHVSYPRDLAAFAAPKVVLCAEREATVELTLFPVRFRRPGASCRGGREQREARVAVEARNAVA